MSPHHRAKRSKVTSPERPRGHNNQVEAAPADVAGFPDLPVELCLEIASYYPHRCEAKDADEDIRPFVEARRTTMFALSQTCRALRRVFLAYLYDSIEVFGGMTLANNVVLRPQSIDRNDYRKTKFYQQRKYAEELIRQLEIVTIRDPQLAHYVKIIDIEVSNHYIVTVMEELARCIALMPNLTTVAFNLLITGRHDICFEYVFENYEYPQIRSLATSEDAIFFVRHCSGLRRLSSIGNFDGAWYPVFLKPGFGSYMSVLEIPLVGISYSISHMPLLTELSLDFNKLANNKEYRNLHELSKLTHLRQLTIKNVWVAKYDSELLQPELEKSWIQPALKALAAIPVISGLPRSKTKQLILEYCSGKTLIIPVAPCKPQT